MKFFSFCILFLIAITSPAISGNSDKFKSSDELIRRATQLHDSGDYASSLKLLDLVTETDPNYPNACYETALNYYSTGDPVKAIAKCEEARFLRYDDPSLYSLMSSILDESGETEKGIRIIREALKKWPYNQNLMYNLGLNYLNAGKPDSAESVFLKSVVLYPYHTRTHLGLAHANYAMGRLAQSYLAFSTAILISPTLNNIIDFENALCGKLKGTPRAYAYPYADGADKSYWDHLKHLVQSEMVFNKDFDFRFKLDYTFTRQMYVLFGNLRNEKNDTSVYGRLYSRFFSELMSSGQYETFINYCLNNLNVDEAVAWNTKNPGKIDGFISWAQQYIDNGRPFAYYINLQEQGRAIHQFTDQVLSSIGEQTGEQALKNGPFIIITRNGAISERGTYVNDLSEGAWKLFWPNGSVRQDLWFVHDVLNDTIRTYFPNGARELIIPFKEGNRHGKFSEFTASGKPVSMKNYVDGKLNGEGTYCNYKEYFTRDYLYVNDTSEGKTHEKWFNGKDKGEFSFKKGAYDGSNLTWYANGKPETEYTYTNDTLTGQFRKFHYNGVLSDSGYYNENGKYSGDLKSFDNKGRITSFSGKYTNGILTGPSVLYFENGKERIILDYKNDSLKHIKSFDAKGKLLYETSAVNDSVYYKLFYDDGIIAREGTMVHGLNKGLWKEYNPQGILVQENMFRDGLLSGMQKYYFPNGTIDREYVCDSSNIIGLYKSYYSNGQLFFRGNYVKEGLDGEAVYFYKNNNVLSKEFYSKGKQAGQHIVYFPDGRLKSREFYNDDGMPVRTINYDTLNTISDDWVYDFGAYEFKETYPDGKTKYIVHIADNVKNGIQEQYYPNGQLAYKGNYISGQVDGVASTFDYKGNPVTEYNYTYGNLDGEQLAFDTKVLSYKSYYENGIREGKNLDYYTFNGKIAKEIDFENGERQGNVDYYSGDGQFMYRVIYKNGVIKAYTWKNSAGDFVPEVGVTSDTKQMVMYYPNGKMSGRIGLKNAQYHGKSATYNSNGLIQSEWEDEYGDITGVYKYYYPDGKLWQFSTYVYDDLNGPFTEYYPNGKIKLKGNYINNERHGKWHVYDVTGKETEIITYYQGTIYAIVTK